MATPNHRANEPLLKKRFIDQNADEICGLCTLVVDAAVLVPCCKKIFCSSCLCSHLADVTMCPGCSAPLNASNVVDVCSVVGRLMGNWILRCDFYKPALAGCPVTPTLQELKTHVRMCSFNPETPGTQLSIRTMNPSNTCEQMLMASPSKLRGDEGDRITSHIVLSRVIDGKLEVKASCRGKLQVFERRILAQTPSDEASHTTQRRRSSEIQQVTEGISGGKGGARAQEVAGLRRLVRL